MDLWTIEPLDAVTTFELGGPRSGSPYRLGEGYSLGDYQPDLTTVPSILLDVDNVSGLRSGNREFAFPIHVLAASRADLGVRTDALLEALNRPTWSLTWTPEGPGMLPLVFDCFRARVQVGWSGVEDGMWTRTIHATFSVLPYGRSSASRSLALAQIRTTTRSKTYASVPSGIVGSARSPVALTVADQASTYSRMIHRAPLLPGRPTPPVLVAELAAKSGSNQTATFASPGVPAHRGTYAVVTDQTTIAAGTVTATINQTVGGAAPTQVLSTTVPALSGNNRPTGVYVVVGYVTLPLVDCSPDELVSAMTIVINDAVSTYRDVILLDVAGQTVWPSTQAVGNLLIEEPPAGKGLGRVLSFAPTAPLGPGQLVMQGTVQSGGPFITDPRTGEAWVTHYSAAVAPASFSLSASYSPRWLAERSA